MRYSLNSVSQSLEVGNSSSWVLSFRRDGASGPDPSDFNLIKSDSHGFTPAIDVDYDQLQVETKTLVVGPGIEIPIPVFNKGTRLIKVTLYDSHRKQIRQAMLDWVEIHLDLDRGVSPTLSGMKSKSLIIDVHHFDLTHNDISNRTTESFYVLPTGALTYRGDQQFAADTLPLEFMVIGKAS